MPSHNQTISSLLEMSPSVSLIDRQTIVSFVLGISTTTLHTHPQRIVSQTDLDLILAHINERAHGIPLAYILGTRSFYGRDFSVNPHVLIPRPESEHIVDAVCDYIASSPHPHPTIYDIGTGSGALITTLALACEKKDRVVNFLASDISHDALVVAKRNALHHNVQDVITFFHSDLLAELLHNSQLIELDAHDALILVANLPYVDYAHQDQLLNSQTSCELQHEPEIALWSHENGLSHYKRLLLHTKQYLADHPLLTITSYYEIDPAQSEEICLHIRAHFPQAKVEFIKDLTNRNRICTFTIAP